MEKTAGQYGGYTIGSVDHAVVKGVNLWAFFVGLRTTLFLSSSSSCLDATGCLARFVESFAMREPPTSAIRELARIPVMQFPQHKKLSEKLIIGRKFIATSSPLSHSSSAAHTHTQIQKWNLIFNYFKTALAVMRRAIIPTL